MSSNYTITFACLNQLHFTKKFVESLDREEVDFSRIVAVDNGSNDGTREWLQDQGFGRVILNNRNLGCGVAWNQGALAIQSKWTVVMNNDVVCAKGWLKNLLASAESHQLQIASPAMVEGVLDYDLKVWAINAANKMQNYCRLGSPHAVCMAIREDVWDEIGYFMPVPKLLGYEDTIFFQFALNNHLKTATVGNAWVHHFGMITQKALKLEKKMDERDSLGNRNLLKLFMGSSWLQRKLGKRAHMQLLRKSRDTELGQFGLTVHSVNRGQEKEWR